MKAIDERIGERVAAHRSELEQLVRQAVDRKLERLIDAEFARRGNGSVSVATSATFASTKICRGCGRTLPASSFEKHRHVSRECRRDQNVEREQRRQADAAEDAEPPRTGGDLAG